ncbi:MAG TPA: hypothetical protein VF495_10055 [Phenylobacterium sp.]
MSDTFFKMEIAGEGQAEVDRALAEIWADLRAHPDIIGGALPEPPELPETSPFSTEQAEAHEGIAAALLIAVATTMAKEAATALWKAVIWPELQKRVPGLTQSKTSDGSGPV